MLLQRTIDTGALVLIKTSPLLSETAGVVLLDKDSLGFDPTAVYGDLVIQASVTASTWSLTVLGPLGEWAPYINEHGSAVTAVATKTYVRVREGIWRQLKVTFATPGGGKVMATGRITGV